MTWHDHNRSMWRQNTRDQMKDFACEGARERLERMLVPLRGNHAELLVEKAGEDLYAFSRALDSTLDDYEAALRAMVANTRTLAEMLALRCRYCGEQSCQQREEHDRMYRASETTVREQASGYERNPFTGDLAPVYKSSAAGAALPSQGPSAAADGAAGSLPPCGPAAHPTEGGAGAGAESPAPARGMDWPTDSTGEWACICGPHDPPGSCPGCPEYAPRGRSL